MKKIYVGNLPWSAGTEELAALFSPFGEVLDSFVVSDRETGRSRGFGFVTFDDDQSAVRAVEELNGSTLDGRTIRVDQANERPRNDRRDNRW